MQMKLSGNTILITGGTSGIGLEFAKQLGNMGNIIIITGRNQTKLDQVVNAHPEFHAYRSDVTNKEDIISLYTQVTKDFPSLNVLINNAGFMKIGKFYEPNEDLSLVTEEIATNLNGPIWMAHQFIPHLKKQNEAAIINVTSLLGIVPLPLSPVYSATKAGLRSFTTSLREQLKHTKIKVFEIAPPATKTELVDIFDEESAGDFDLMKVDELIKSAVQGLKKDQFEIRPGQTNQVYYLSRLVPKAVIKILSKSLDRMLQKDKKNQR